MKKAILIWLLLVLCAYLAYAGYAGSVTKEEVKVVAVNWLNSRSEHYFDQNDVLSVEILRENEGVPIYLVRFIHKGWVLISGINKTEPVLGYSASTVFKQGQLPVQLDKWLDGLNSELSQAAKENYVSTKRAEERWAYYNSSDRDVHELKSMQTTSAGPLLSTTWNQGQYYNEMAPYDANSNTGNNHVWIGCVATAMAQVMKYWEYPVSGKGSSSYYHSDYGTQSADYEATTYNWGLMPDHLSSGNTEVQKISYHAAVSVEMDFSPSGSGASLTSAVDAFTDYFNYNSTLLWVDKNEWDTETEWKEMLRREIDNGRPVIYSGYNSSHTSAHAFICDGYSSGDYFHFNWGWGGNYNGNFLLSSLTPYIKDYTNSQSAIFGIEPIETASINYPYVNGFETGKGDFSLFGNSSVSVDESHTGSYSVKLSSEGFSSKSKNIASLTFEVPANAMLNFWVKRYTPEESGYNIQKAILYSEYGTESLHSFFMDDFNDSEWKNCYIDLSAYEGQTLRLMFIQENLDPAKEQWMYVDDVAITGGSTNLPPYEPSSPSPSDNETSVSLSPLLQWAGGDPNGDDVLYKVYFDESSASALNTYTTKNYKRFSGLKPKTTYFWRIQSDDGESRVYGDIWSFTTRGLPPDVEQCGISTVTSNSVVLCGNIVDDNGSVVNERGFWWSQYPGVQQSDNELLSNDISQNFEVLLEGLEPYTIYYAKPFADSNEGYGYGDEFQFRTASENPLVDFISVDNVKRNSAVITGSISSLNDSMAIKRGVIWSLDEEFSTQNITTVTEEGAWETEGEFDILIENIPGPDTVYFKLFVENTVGLTYSISYSFVAENNAPVIDLDADNSSGNDGNNYSFYLTEQSEGGVVADVDVAINDADGDVMKKISVVLNKQLNDEDEFLMYLGNTDSVMLSGNMSDSLVLESNDACSNGWWADVIGNIEYRNNSDAPDESFVREIVLWVNDGYDESPQSISTVTMISVNDVPVPLQSPSLSVLPKYDEFSYGIVQGEWVDSLDHQPAAVFEYIHSWEVDFGDTVEIVNEGIDSLFIDDTFCGKRLRILEKVIDIGSGGDNAVSAQNYSEWFDVERAFQEVVDFNLNNNSGDSVISVEFSEKPYLLTGTSSSGLPLSYRTSGAAYVEVSGDRIFVNNVGVDQVYAVQEGNVCYAPSGEVSKDIYIEKGNQILSSDMDSVYSYTDDSVKISVTSSVGLEVDIESSDTSVLRVEGDYLLIEKAGQAYLYFTQGGDDYYNSADTLSFLISIEKGMQTIDAPDTIIKRYDEEVFNVSALSNASLDIDYAVIGDSVISKNDSLFSINAVGEAKIAIQQIGNENWLPASDTVLCIVERGMQNIIFDLISTVSCADGMLILDAESTSGLDIKYNVPDDGIADIVGDTLLFHVAGEVSVSASQEGDKNWLPAETIVQNILINKASQQITTLLDDTITANQIISYNDFQTSSGMTVSNIISSDNDIIYIQNDSIDVKESGDVTLTVSQSGNSCYMGAEEDFDFHVAYSSNVERFEDIMFDLFPNPAIDKLHLNIDGDVKLPLDFSLLNVLGQIQMTKKITKQFQVVDIKNIDSGTYIVLLRNDDYYITKKIMVK